MNIHVATDADLRKWYNQNKKKYTKFCEEIEHVISVQLDNDDIKYHTIESRVKTEESYFNKANKIDTDGVKKYTNPEEQITDLAGIRVILYSLKDVSRVREALQSQFILHE
jgi:putative GTP pyrophosphokinase